MNDQPCRRCGADDFGFWQSSSGSRSGRYCRPCRARRADAYLKRRRSNGGSHTQREWLALLAATPECPGCDTAWAEISPRPDRRYKHTWTKDHKVPLRHGGTDDIGNIQPLCYSCNFKKATTVKQHPASLPT